jgi:hypothetical protein
LIIECVRFLHAQAKQHARQISPAIEAQAMKRETGREKRRIVGSVADRPKPHDELAGLDAESSEEDLEFDESEPDAAALQRTDERLWDVFILDDEPDPLPDYGDFWFPD